MKVLKFGGTSVGSAARMKDVAKLICDGDVITSYSIHYTKLYECNCQNKS